MRPNHVSAGARPPLGVWLLALVLAGLTLLVLSRSWLIEWLEVMPSVDAFNLARLEAPKGPGLRVVALGTSKTRQALPFDGDFPASRDAAGVPLQFQRFSASKADFHILQPVLVGMLEQPPDVLLLESDLLLYDREQPYGHALLADFRTGMQLIIRRMRGTLHRVFPLASENSGADSWSSESRCLASRTPGQLAGYASYAQTWQLAPERQQQDFIEVLRRLQLQGTFIVLLDVPRAPHADQLVQAKLESQVTVLRRQLQVQEGYAYWSPGVLEDRLYCDQGHLTRNGRQVYTQWLSQQLRAWRAERGQP